MAHPLEDLYFGLHKTTFIDFPGEVAATLFLRGCNLRCPYCHNPSLVDIKTETGDFLSWQEIDLFLNKRKNLLGGICVSGGEPLMQPALPELIDRIHHYGLKVKIDTNGTFPKILKKLKVEYIAMDLKTVPEKYHLLVPGKDKTKEVKESVRYIINSGIPHEFRTTAVPEIVDLDDLRKMAKLIKGCDKFKINIFRPGQTLDESYTKTYPADYLGEMVQVMKKAGINASIRQTGG